MKKLLQLATGKVEREPSNSSRTLLLLNNWRSFILKKYLCQTDGKSLKQINQEFFFVLIKIFAKYLLEINFIFGIELIDQIPNRLN